MSLREQRSPINTEGISVSPVKAPIIINDITWSWKKKFGHFVSVVFLLLFKNAQENYEEKPFLLVWAFRNSSTGFHVC